MTVYTFFFVGPDGKVYTAATENRAAVDTRLGTLVRDKCPMILLLQNQAPWFLWTRRRDGGYNRRAF